jgi:hypothetical protein
MYRDLKDKEDLSMVVVRMFICSCASDHCQSGCRGLECLLLCFMGWKEVDGWLFQQL